MSRGPNEYVELSPTCHVQMEELRPALPRAAAGEQFRSVGLIGFFGGVIGINRDLSPYDHEVWRGHHGLDSLGLKLTGLTDKECDALLVREPQEATGDITKGRIKKQRAVNGGIILPGLARLAFDQNAVTVVQEDESVLPALDAAMTAQMQRGLKGLELASQGAPQEVILLMHPEIASSQRTLKRDREAVFEVLGTPNAQAAVTRLCLGGYFGRPIQPAA